MTSMSASRRLACPLVADLLLALLVLHLHLQHGAADELFGDWSMWTERCASQLRNGSATFNCTLQLAQATSFVYSQSNHMQASFADMTSACQSCIPDLSQQVGAEMNATKSDGTCPYFRQPRSLEIMLQAGSLFACLPQPDGSNAGICVNAIAATAASVGLLQPVMLMNDSYGITDAQLPTICSALVPTLCCFRTWTTLMAALAQQLCRTNLANILLTLPGRCSALVDGAVQGACYSDWNTTLQPLLTPRTDCTPGMPDYWDGSACSATQTARAGCYSSACDLWCGLQPELDAADRAYGFGRYSQPPAVVQDASLTTGALAFIIVFSVVVALLVIAVIGYRIYWRQGYNLEDAGVPATALGRSLRATTAGGADVQVTLRQASTLAASIDKAGDTQLPLTPTRIGRTSSAFGLEHYRWSASGASPRSTPLTTATAAAGDAAAPSAPTDSSPPSALQGPDRDSAQVQTDDCQMESAGDGPQHTPSQCAVAAST